MQQTTLLGLALTCATGTTALAQTPTLTPLGASRQPTSISADGTIVAGAAGGGPAFRWTAGTGSVMIGGTGGQPTVSPDGSKLAADASDPMSSLVTAAFWLGGTAWDNLGGLPGGTPSGSSLSHTYGLSRDGSVLVGLGWINAGTAHAFRWEQGTGMVDLGSTVAGSSSRANAVAADNADLVVGWQDRPNGFRQGAAWINGVQSLFFINGDAPVGEASAVTPDGSVVVGQSAMGEAWRWTAATGVEKIGLLPGFFFQGMAFDVSDDGSTVVGSCGFGFDRDAFIWFEGMGMLKLDDYLTGLGLDLTGWDLGSATAISGDGSIIAGWGSGPSGPFDGWVIEIPTATVTYCTAGTTASGCSAQIAATGAASATANSGFFLNTTLVEGEKDGLYFLGTNGRQANTWGNGTSFQCVVPPVTRAGLLTGSGTSGLCDGGFSQDLNTLWCPTCPKPQKNPGAGALVQAQLWFRDPFNTSNQTTSLSNAIEFLVHP